MTWWSPGPGVGARVVGRRRSGATTGVASRAGTRPKFRLRGFSSARADETLQARREAAHIDVRAHVDLKAELAGVSFAAFGEG
jgi:hypothetical protein